jgi:hypothetical protein
MNARHGQAAEADQGVSQDQGSGAIVAPGGSQAGRIGRRNMG